MSQRVVVIDYGAGNLHSVLKGLREAGAAVEVTADAAAVRAADRVVLPGVGAFADGMAGLHRHGLDEAVQAVAAAGRPLLGICLGMQMLLSVSEEFGEHAGLGLIPGRVSAIPPQPGWKVPHIGWSRIFPREGGSWAGTLLAGTPDGTPFYFVHSLAGHTADPAHCLAVAPYGACPVAAAVQRGASVGLQFHPEKSGPAGLALLQRFLHL